MKGNKDYFILYGGKVLCMKHDLSRRVWERRKGVGVGRGLVPHILRYF